MALMKGIRTLCAHSKSILQTFNPASFPIFGRVGILNFRRTLPALSNYSQQITSYSSEVNKKLMEFFDSKNNWGVNEVRVGRAWRKEELRIKSNVDLHKLWYVLLKERNMLMSMEHESNEEMKLFPNPERFDKVEESMRNLEEVTRERNKAYYLLETGEDGERPGRLAINRLGIRYFYKMKEYPIPRHKNLRWWRGLQVGYEESPSLNRFLRLYREKLFLAKKKQRRRNLNHVQHLMRRFPNMDSEAVNHHYPEVDLNKARQAKRARGNHEFNF